jgi:hypothetical protein
MGETARVSPAVDILGRTDQQVASDATNALCALGLESRSAVALIGSVCSALTVDEINGAKKVPISEVYPPGDGHCPCLELPAARLFGDNARRITQEDAVLIETIALSIVRSHTRDRGMLVKVRLHNVFSIFSIMTTGEISISIYNTGMKFVPIMTLDTRKDNTIANHIPPFFNIVAKPPYSSAEYTTDSPIASLCVPPPPPQQPMPASADVSDAPKGV